MEGQHRRAGTDQPLPLKPPCLQAAQALLSAQAFQGVYGTLASAQTVWDRFTYPDFTADVAGAGGRAVPPPRSRDLRRRWAKQQRYRALRGTICSRLTPPRLLRLPTPAQASS